MCFQIWLMSLLPIHTQVALLQLNQDWLLLQYLLRTEQMYVFMCEQLIVLQASQLNCELSSSDIQTQTRKPKKPGTVCADKAKECANRVNTCTQCVRASHVSTDQHTESHHHITYTWSTHCAASLREKHHFQVINVRQNKDFTLYNSWSSLYKSWSSLYKSWSCLYNSWSCLYNSWSCLYNSWSCLYNSWSSLYK